MGLGEGTTFPALSVLLASWVPEKERSKIGSFVFGGGQVCTVFFSTVKILFINKHLLNKHLQFQIGTVAGTLLSGLILHWYSWEWVFYIFGIASIVWFIIFVSQSTFTFLFYSFRNQKK